MLRIMFPLSLLRGLSLAVILSPLPLVGVNAQDSGALAPMMARDPATQTTNDRATAQLFEAVQANDLNLVQASVASGANIRAVDRWGLTPAEIAVDKGNFEIAHFLISIQNAQRANAAPVASTRKSPAPILSPTAPASPTPPPGTSLTYRGYSTTQRTGPARPVVDQAANPTPGPFDPNAPVIGGDLRPIGETALAHPEPSGDGQSGGAQ